MKDMIKMVVVLTILSTVSGGLLGAVHHKTRDRIENQQLKFVKGPAILSILEGASNDPMADRFKLPVAGEEKSFFVGLLDGEQKIVAFETSATGFGGPVGLMVGVNLATDEIQGVSVTTHSETPGLGSRAKSDPNFAKQFEGVSILEPVNVTSDGGGINAIAGATITSRAVCGATTEAGKIYRELKTKITEQAQPF